MATVGNDTAVCRLWNMQHATQHIRCCAMIKQGEALATPPMTENVGHLAKIVTMKLEQKSSSERRVAPREPWCP